MGGNGHMLVSVRECLIGFSGLGGNPLNPKPACAVQLLTLNVNIGPQEFT